MIKRLYFVPLIILCLILIAGCGRSGSNNYNHPEIEQLISNFESAVEAYNVAGMLTCLSDAQFQLTITEAGISYNKDKTTLTTELNNDSLNQTNWRKSVANGGNGYVLDLVLGTPGYSNETTTGAIVTQTFQVYESAVSPSIPRMKTDNGNITWQLAKTGGLWKTTAMTIEYQAVSGSASIKASFGSKPSGFGFARLSL